MREKRNRGAGKVPRPVGQRGNRFKTGGVYGLLEPFKIEEEESLIVTVVHLGYVDRTADRGPKVVLAVDRPDLLPVLLGVKSARVGEGQARVEGFVHEILVGASVKLVGAGFHGVVEVAASRLPKLRRKIAGLDGYFLDRVDAALVDLSDLVPHAIGRVLTVDANGFRGGGQAVHAYTAIGGIHDAREKLGDRQRIANVAEAVGKKACASAQCQHRKVVRVINGHVVAQFAALGLQEGSLGGDGNRVGDRAHVQLDVLPNVRRHRDNQVLADEFLEASHGDRQRVFAYRHGNHKVARG